ncbi:deoxyribose-phosphate aldolase [Streptococcus pneumoniae]|uniref:deoxyribose-phosphate aldolase n=1 Tax=Streptococcus pneumoniae TaxID=1313 RepID=UPI000598E498|nr:deoxyribose-phosphate aldolase [Streptococcus pneumoniae]CEO66284.1 deoxyribose-phosphate aldolase [Streptococcus pneumoniae]CEX68575.1 deoxyribose-phosphate aldolase [Streptococcus pneumoniae]CIT57456.1 deoxyribose-phosphate aldolase [Streptococcus pneumoniae]CJF58974.1 deoxyribose-phosphate aldolase [Streptococcus pneumoniae]CJG72747.1 deoxyribose-phosphate aldolase [Streptococcus pneumoniae]
MKLNKYIDHTLLKQDAKKKQIDSLLSEAREYGFASVCVNPTWVEHAKKGLEGTDVKVCTVVGFPLGATTSAVKAFETKEAIQNGADEIDMVINVGALKSGNLALVESDIRAVVEASGDKLVKVIIEACLLTDQEKVLACQLAQKAGSDFVKTSTGFSTGGATIADVRLMRETVGSDMGVKAAGGATIADVRLMRETVGSDMGVKAAGGARSYADALAFVEAGATRIGTSAGVAILKGELADGDY